MKANRLLRLIVVCMIVTLPQQVVRGDSLSGSRPNIVFLLTDDQGYGDVSAHGNPILKTPTLDRLHRESFRFTDFHVSPTCAPTRSALFTGRHEFKNGITHTILERERLTRDAVTLAQALQSAGYSTGIFGKWHLGDEAEYQPGKRGFDEVFIHGGGGIGQVYPGSCGDAPGNTYFNPALLHNSKFEKTEGYCTDLFYQQAIRWMDGQRKSGKPFFAYIPTNAPHGPYTAKPEDAELYQDKVDNKNLAHFYGMIHNIDQNISRLLGKLSEWGIEQNTLVVFMNDNGTAAGQNVWNAGMRGAKGTAWLGGTRSSCFWRWPGKIKPDECKKLAAHIDFFPTVADLAGIKLTEQMTSQIEGRSLLPLIQDPNSAWNDRRLFTHVGRWPKFEDPNNWKYKMTSVRNSRWSLVSPDGGREPKWQLFDLENDYAQSTNVIDQHPEIVTELSKAMDQWWLDCQPKLVNEKVVGPQLNPFAEWYWQQFGGGPTDEDRKKMDPNQVFPAPNNARGNNKS
ncbi:MAG: arylsulfatase [Pirellulales bacterium]